MKVREHVTHPPSRPRNLIVSPVAQVANVSSTTFGILWINVRYKQLATSSFRTPLSHQSINETVVFPQNPRTYPDGMAVQPLVAGVPLAPVPASLWRRPIQRVLFAVAPPVWCGFGRGAVEGKGCAENPTAHAGPAPTHPLRHARHPERQERLHPAGAEAVER